MREQIFHKLTDEMLSTFAQVYDGVDDESQELLNSLKKAKEGSLDDDTLNRTKEQYTERLEYLDAGEKQFHKWLVEEKPNEFQAKEINRFLKIISRTREITYQVLELCKKLENQTIDKILEKSDFDLAMEFLSKF